MKGIRQARMKCDLLEFFRKKNKSSDSMRVSKDHRETDHREADNRDSAETVAMKIIVTLFILSFIPILCVGMYTHPTGDDYWYGKWIMKAWREQHSIFACIGAAFTTIKEFYYTWQGTWYSIFLFCFNPEMFVKGGYKIVPVLAIGLLGGGFFLVMYQSMVKILKLSKEVLWVCFCVLLFQMLQYMPRTTSGIYWFNGVMHYNANTFTAMVAIGMMILYLREGKKYAYILVLVSMFLIGGGNYQAALMPLLFWGFLVLGTFFYVEKGTTLKDRIFHMIHAKRVWPLGVGVLLELPGVAISGLAPGNSLRSEEYEVSLKWALQSVYYSIDRGIYLVRDDFYAKYPAMLLFIVMLAVFLWFAMWKVQDKITFRFPVPVLFVLYMCGIYWAMYTPGIFSKADVSGGVPDTIQQIFLLTSLANVIYVIGYVQRVLREHVREEKLKTAWWGPGCYGSSPAEGTDKATVSTVRSKDIIMLTATAGMIFAGILGYHQSTDKLCVDLVESGHAKVYDMVRKEQIRILEDETVTDAYIPELFDFDYYPICHIQASTDPDYRLNYDIAVYYDKDSVTAYDFREWFEEEKNSNN